MQQPTQTAAKDNAPAKLYASVVHVSDGDTITVQTKTGEKHKIRFYGIDAPEKAQPYGPQSTGILKNLVLNKNVDIVIFNKQTDDISAPTMKGLMADAKVLHLMGELKGGIDPAGGDEHWKTTRGALERIREAYKKSYVIFIGASIEKSMSEEIYTQLQNGQLDYVANLTNADQLAAMCGWIVEQ